MAATLQVAINAAGSAAGAAVHEASVRRVATSSATMSGAVNKGSASFAAAGLAIGAFSVAGFAGVAVMSKLARGAKTLAVEMATLAGEQEEVDSKFEAVFKKQAPNALRRLEEISERTGRSALAMRGFASSLQDTFVPLGVARDNAAEMSTALVQLAVDLGSFNDIAASDVIDNFSSALVGQGLAVKKYGIIITVETVKAEAYASGIARMGEKLTEAQKIQARYNLLFKSTADAQGDAERTAGSYTNTLIRLNDRMEDLKKGFGKEITKAVVDFVEELGGVDEIADQVGVGLGTVAFIAKESVGIFADLALGAKGMALAFGDVNQQLGKIKGAYRGGEFLLATFMHSVGLPTLGEMADSVAAYEEFGRQLSDALDFKSLLTNAGKAEGAPDVTEGDPDFTGVTDEGRGYLITRLEEYDKRLEQSQARKLRFGAEELALHAKLATTYAEQAALIDAEAEAYGALIDRQEEAGEFTPKQAQDLKDLNEQLRKQLQNTLALSEAEEYDKRLEQSQARKLRFGAEELALNAKLATTYAEQAALIDAEAEAYGALIDRQQEAGEFSETQAEDLKDLNEQLRKQLQNTLALSEAERDREAAEDANRKNREADEEKARQRQQDLNYAAGQFANGLVDAAVAGDNLGETMGNVLRQMAIDFAKARLQAILLQIALGASNSASSGPETRGHSPYYPSEPAAKGGIYPDEYYARGGFPDGFIGGPLSFRAGQGKRGYAGEAGPEVGAGGPKTIFPVVSLGNGKVGVEGTGGGGGTVIVNLNMPNVRTPQDFGRSQSQITRQVQGAMQSLS